MKDRSVVEPQRMPHDSRATKLTTPAIEGDNADPREASSTQDVGHRLLEALQAAGYGNDVTAKKKGLSTRNILN